MRKNCKNLKLYSRLAVIKNNRLHLMHLRKYSNILMAIMPPYGPGIPQTDSVKAVDRGKSVNQRCLHTSAIAFSPPCPPKR